MTAEQPIPVDHGEPIPRPVIHEVVQMLGYDINSTVRVIIDYGRVMVTTTEVVDHQVVDLQHVHVIV